jgi:hypothetical protein
MFIFLGWLVGLAVGTIGIVALLLAGGASVPAFLSGFASILATLLAALAPWLAFTLAVLFIVASFLIAYLGATASISVLLPGATGLPVVTFPLASPLSTPGGVAVTIPASPGEFFARGVLIGLSAAINTVLLLLIAGTVLAVWAFFVISLAAIIFVARNRVYQGFLGWSGWLLPLSYLATGVGLLLFVVNFPFAFATFGVAAFALDWSTGVIETRGGVTGITGFNGGFSLGNFTFLTLTTAAGAGPAPARFMTPTVSSHETGHSLNTAAMGGVVLWINAVDENILPRRLNLAYGELTAEGHSRNMPGVARADYSIRLWV